jgi:hypothetical protein
MLRKGQKCKASYSIDIIIQRVVESCSTGLGPGLVIHADNARPHAAQKALRLCRDNRLEVALGPLCSPDLAPPGFFLFGYVKRALEGAEFPSEETLLAAIQSDVPDLTVDTLRAVFAHWAEGLKWVALKQGHYYRQPKQSHL